MSMDLLIGSGEVGSALLSVLSERREFAVHDPPKGIEAKAGEYDWMHIAMGWNDKFVTQVNDYIREFDPKHVVVHSTVPIGTTAEILHLSPQGNRWLYYSPVRGIHPHLARYLREFPKWYASAFNGQADKEIIAYYAEAGIQARKAPSFDTLEFFKLAETTEYGYRISLWQEWGRIIRKLSDKGRKSNEEVVSALNDWMFEKRKVYDGDRGFAPIMYDGPILGHCVEPNYALLEPFMLPEFYAWLTKSNELRKEK